MAERINSSVVRGLVQKHLAWDQFLGDKSPTSLRAFELSLERCGGNTESDDKDNWLKAEKEVCQRYIQELTSQLA